MNLSPEQATAKTLNARNKPSFDVYEIVEKDYRVVFNAASKDQHLVNYFIVGHPGTDLAAAVELFEKLLARNYSPEQVQEFIPLPMTRACVQYTTGKDPITLAPLYVPRGGRERRLQKALVRWKDPENRRLVEEALADAGREDLLEPFQRALRRGPGPKSARARPAPQGEASLDLDTCG